MRWKGSEIIIVRECLRCTFCAAASRLAQCNINVTETASMETDANPIGL